MLFISILIDSMLWEIEFRIDSTIFHQNLTDFHQNRPQTLFFCISRTWSKTAKSHWFYWKSNFKHFQHFSLVPTPPKSIKLVWKAGFSLLQIEKYHNYEKTRFQKYGLWLKILFTLPPTLHYFALFCIICALCWTISH